MRLGLNIVTTFLHSLKPRKLLSGSRKTYLPNIFVRHNPRLAARAARLRASKSARSIRAAPSFTSTADGTGTHSRRHHRHARSLRRSTTNAAAAVFPAPVPSFPQPPGAYACAAPSSASFTTTTIPDGCSTPLVAQKVFFDELYKQRAVLMRATDERLREAEARAAEDKEFLRLLAEDQRKAQEAQRRAEAEEALRMAEELRLKEEIEAKERRKRRTEERRRRRAAREERRESARLEQERLEQERREQERLHEELREQERREKERRVREQDAALRQQAAAEAALAQNVAKWHSAYEEKWALLRADVQLRPLAFSDIPWPVFGIPMSAEDVTDVRVQEFLCHPQRESVQSAGPAKSLRSEMLRWHPDKFNAKVLNKVVEGEREAVMEAAGKVARFLTQLTAEMQGR